PPERGSNLAPARRVAGAARRRLLAHPLQVRLDLRRLPQPLQRRVQCRQRLVGVGGVDHAVALAADQLDVLDRAAFGRRQAVVAGEVPLLERPAPQAAGDGRRGRAGHGGQSSKRSKRNSEYQSLGLTSSRPSVVGSSAKRARPNSTGSLPSLAGPAASTHSDGWPGRTGADTSRWNFGAKPVWLSSAGQITTPGSSTTAPPPSPRRT